MTVFGIPGANKDPLAYADVRLSLIPGVQAPRRPTITDVNYPLFTEWRVTKDAVSPAVEGEFWKLVGFTGPGEADWVQIGVNSISLVTLTGDTGGAVDGDASDNITFIGAGGITIAGNPGAHTLTFTGSSAMVTWTEVTGTSAVMSVNTGYIANNVAQVDLQLPTSAAQGDRVIIVGKGAGGWSISQSGTQVIHYLGDTTSSGVAGSISPNEARGTLELVCITATTDWAVIYSTGNFVLA